MNALPAHAADANQPDSQPFTRLIRELHDLGFEATHTDNTMYAATDSAATVTIVHRTHPPHVRVSTGHTDTQALLTWTADTPHHTQLICLYAALNDDPTAAIEAAAAAIGIDAPTGVAEPSRTAG
jgi:hypothetical protein